MPSTLMPAAASKAGHDTATDDEASCYVMNTSDSLGMMTNSGLLKMLLIPSRYPRYKPLSATVSTWLFNPVMKMSLISSGPEFQQKPQVCRT